MPLTLIGEAVFARCLSALKDERVAASKVLNGPRAKFKGDQKKMIERSDASPVCFQDRLLRPGLSADACGGGRIQLESELWRYRPDVAGRVHHSVGVPRQESRKPSTAIPI